MWQFILVGSTFGAFIVSFTLTVLLYVFFGGGQCATNTTLVTVNLVLTLILTIASVSPAVQEANPKSGLAQASIVSLYSTYLVSSAVGNHNDPGGVCNPLTSGSTGARTTTVVLGGVFTFLAVAYSTTRAATQTKALGGKKGGAVRLEDDLGEGAVGGEEGHGLVDQQPRGKRRNEMRYQAVLAAVEAGCVPSLSLSYCPSTSCVWLADLPELSSVLSVRFPVRRWTRRTRTTRTRTTASPARGTTRRLGQSTLCVPFLLLRFANSLLSSLRLSHGEDRADSWLGGFFHLLASGSTPGSTSFSSWRACTSLDS